MLICWLVDLRQHPLRGVPLDAGCVTTNQMKYLSDGLTVAVPSNLFLNKIGKPAVYLSASMVLWGIISTATAGVQSYGGLVAVRFFLGFVEAAYFVGSVFSSALLFPSFFKYMRFPL